MDQSNRKVPMIPITIRVSHRSYEAVKEIAKVNVLSKAEVMRLAMNGQLQAYLMHVRFEDKQQGDEIRSLVREVADETSRIRMELNRIGVNYNQLARLRNTENKYGDSPEGAGNGTPAAGADLSKEDLDALIARYEKAAGEVAELCRILG